LCPLFAEGIPQRFQILLLSQFFKVEGRLLLAPHVIEAGSDLVKCPIPIFRIRIRIESRLIMRGGLRIAFEVHQRICYRELTFEPKGVGLIGNGIYGLKTSLISFKCRANPPPAGVRMTQQQKAFRLAIVVSGTQKG
jgi:hypothetical protein